MPEVAQRVARKSRAGTHSRKLSLHAQICIADLCVACVRERKLLDRDTGECLRQKPTSEGKRQLRVCLFWTVWTLLREACVSTQAVPGVPPKAPKIDVGETQGNLSLEG